MKKILYFVQMPPPQHGVSTINELVVKSKIINNNYETLIIPIQFSKKISEINKVSIKKIKYMLLLLFTLIKTLVQQKPDLVYFTISPYGKAFYRDFLFTLLIKVFVKKLIIHIHGLGIAQNSTSIIYHLCSKIIYNNTYTIHLSKSILKDFKKYESIIKKQFVVNNGITDCSPSFEKHQNTNDYTHILYLSNYLPTKGHENLLDALGNIKKLNINFKCTFAGSISDSKYFEELKQKTAHLNLQDQVVFLNFIDGNEKTKLFQSADIFVFPTLFESFGIVALEAMMNKIPVIANNIGSLPEIIDEDVGFIYNNQDELVEKLLILMNDNFLCKQMGEAARKKFLKRYTQEVFEKKMCEVFKEVVNK